MLKSNVEIYLSFNRVKRLYDKELFPNEKRYLSEAIDSYGIWSLSELVYYLDEVPKEKLKLNWEFRKIKRLEKLTNQEKKLYYLNYLKKIEDIGKKQIEKFENIINYFDLKLTQSDRILEVGCGHGGFMSQFMKKYSNEIIGVDMDTSSLLINNKINQIIGNDRYDLFAQFGDNLPFEDDSFNLIVCFATIEHVGDFKAKLNFIAELIRVCKVDGLIIIEFPNRYDIFTPEAHVGLRFLGFFPHSIMHRCSLLFREMPYDDIYPSSFIEIRRLLRSLFIRGKKYKIISWHYFTKKSFISFILNNFPGIFFGAGFIVAIHNSE